MRRERITITIDSATLKKVDSIVDKTRIRNRSHAIEHLVNKALPTRVRKVVILAGGPGTRFRPLTYEIPSALIPFKDRTVLEHIILRLSEVGLTDIVICTGHLGDKIEHKIKDGSAYGVSVTYARENKPIGTGGAIYNARNLLNESPFLVLHSDILSNIDYLDLFEFHNSEKRHATLALTTKPDPENYGVVRVKGTQIVNFLEKPTSDADSNLIHAGIYVLEHEVMDIIGKIKKKTISMEKDVFPQIANDHELTGYMYDGQWFDISIPESYENALKVFNFKGTS